MAAKLKENSAGLVTYLYEYFKGDVRAIFTFISQNTPTQIFKQVGLSGPAYEKKKDHRGKLYNCVENWKKNWKSEAVWEAKVLQYVPQAIRDQFEVPAPLLPASAGTAASAGDALAPAPAVAPVTPANRSSTVEKSYLENLLAASLQVSDQRNAQLQDTLAASIQANDQRHAQLFEIVAASQKANDQRHAQLQEIVAASQKVNDQRHTQLQEIVAASIKVNDERHAELSSDLGTLAADTKQQFDDLTDAMATFKANLLERFEEQQKLDNAEKKEEKSKPQASKDDLDNAEKEGVQKKSTHQVVFTTRNEYFTIPARDSTKKRKPALSKKDDQSTPTQPVARPTRSRSVQGSTPKRATRSSSRLAGK